MGDPIHPRLPPPGRAQLPDAMLEPIRCECGWDEFNMVTRVKLSRERLDRTQVSGKKTADVFECARCGREPDLRP